MRIALDAMGGDRAPAAVVEGALLAVEQAGDLELILVGRPEEIEPHLDGASRLAGRISVHPASQVVGMDQTPSHAVRRLDDASIRVCFELCKAGEAQAVVSAGNSGATLAFGMLVMGRLPLVERPALASVLPGMDGPTVLIDVGANVDCTPLMLLQFGYMGCIYAERVLGIPRPTVGLLSIGEERGKGNLVVKQAYESFNKSALNFVGNVEGRDLFSGVADVVACDGFVGNVCLKLSEAVAETVLTMLRKQVEASVKSRLGGMLLKGDLHKMAAKMDYATYGGAPLLGLDGVAFICHGASSPKAIASALAHAAEAVRSDLPGRIGEGMASYRGVLQGDSTKE